MARRASSLLFRTRRLRADAGDHNRGADYVYGDLAYARMSIFCGFIPRASTFIQHPPGGGPHHEFSQNGSLPGRQSFLYTPRNWGREWPPIRTRFQTEVTAELVGKTIVE